MSINQFFDRLDVIDASIKRESTGSRNQFADHVGVSPATLHNTIKFMRQRLKAPIQYDHMRKTYFYAYRGLIHFDYNHSPEIQWALEFLASLKKKY